MGLRIVIAEDSLLMREGVRQVVGLQPDLEVIGDCADLPSLRALVEAEKPDVVVTDVRMPPTFGDEGISMAVELRRTHPEMGVVVLSQYAEPAYARALLGAGSARRAYLLKERVSEPGELAQAIRTVAAGGSVVDPALVRELVQARRVDDPLSVLTPREREVLGRMAEGRSNAGIARALWVAEGTVEKHVRSIMAKLDLPETTDDHRRVLAVITFLEAH
jgi:DNA-binding NarL/FixJ family response regulator